MPSGQKNGYKHTNNQQFKTFQVPQWKVPDLGFTNDWFSRPFGEFTFDMAEEVFQKAFSEVDR